MSSIYVTLSTTMPWFFPVVVFLFGACIGSFLNVCIYRIPAGKSVVRPGSQCACGKPIAWYDNLPVLSWFILRGRARCCQRPYSFRYPAIELLTALLFLACWMLFSPAKALCGMFFISALICATLIDLDHFEIPDVFTIWLGVSGVVLAFAVPSLHGQTHDLFIVASLRSGVIALKGLLIGSALILWIAIIAEAILKKEAMGFGDVKFLGAIGAFCGWQGAVVALFGGAMLGSIWFIGALIWGKLRGKKVQVKALESEDEPAEIGMGAQVPYGPMLAAGALLYYLVLHRWVDLYFAQISEIL